MDYQNYIIRMQKENVIFMTGFLGVTLVACATESSTYNPTESSTTETVQDPSQEKEQETSESMQEGEAEQNKEETESIQESIENDVETQPDEEDENTQNAEKYEDNFAVDSDASAAFSKRIKDAVANQKLYLSYCTILSRNASMLLLNLGLFLTKLYTKVQKRILIL